MRHKWLFILMCLACSLFSRANTNIAEAGWEEMSSGTGWDLHSVWGSSGNDVFAVGGNGTILQYTPSPTLATGNSSSYKNTVTKVEMYNGTSWITIFSGTASLDMVKGGTFPGISELNLPAGTYSQVRVTFNNAFPVSGMLNYSGTNYYTTGTTYGGQTNLASTPTTVAGDKAVFTFYNPDITWGVLNAEVTQAFPISPITVGPNTDYQPTLRFTISKGLFLKGTTGNPSRAGLSWCAD